MSTTYVGKKKKKKVLRKIRIGEVSGVDKPAQTPAVQLIMKRDDIAKVSFDEALEQMELEEKLFHALEDMWKLNDALRRSVRAIVEDPETYPDPVAAVQESLGQFTSAVSSMIAGAVGELEEEAEEDDMEKATKTEGGSKFPSGDFAYVPDAEKPSTWKLRLTSTPGGEPDARIVGAAVAALGKGFRGNKVQIPSDELPMVKRKVKSAWLKANPDKDASDLPQVIKLKKIEDEEMTKEERERLEKAENALRELTEKNDKRDVELTAANAVIALPADQRAHYDSLAESDRTDFLAKSDDDRGRILKNAADSNPVIYTSADGEEFRKNDDPRLIRIVKSADEDRKLAKAEREKRETVEFEKRAEAELKNLPGDTEVKVSVLRAVAGIENEDVRKAAAEMFKAGNDAMTQNFRTIGHTDGSIVKDDGAGGDKADAEIKLDEMTKRAVEAEPALSYAEAYDKVLKTDEGSRLYSKYHG